MRTTDKQPPTTTGYLGVNAMLQTHMAALKPEDALKGDLNALEKVIHKKEPHKLKKSKTLRWFFPECAFPL